MVDRMQYYINKDKKIADTFEAVVGAIAKIGKLPHAFDFLKKLTVLTLD